MQKRCTSTLLCKYTNKIESNQIKKMFARTQSVTHSDVVMLRWGNGITISATPWESNAYKLLKTQCHQPRIDCQKKEGRMRGGRIRGGNLQCHWEQTTIMPLQLPRKTAITSSSEEEKGREREKQTGSDGKRREKKGK